MNKLIRLSPSVRDLLARLAVQSGENESAVVRRLIAVEGARFGIVSQVIAITQ